MMNQFPQKDITEISSFLIPFPYVMSLRRFGMRSGHYKKKEQKNHFPSITPVIPYR